METDFKRDLIDAYRFIRDGYLQRYCPPHIDSNYVMKAAFFNSGNNKDKEWARNIILQSKLDLDMMEKLYNFYYDRNQIEHQTSVDRSNPTPSLQKIKDIFLKINPENPYFDYKDSIINLIDSYIKSISLLFLKNISLSILIVLNKKFLTQNSFVELTWSHS